MPLWAAAIVLAIAGAGAHAEDLGRAPDLGAGARDLAASFRLPELRDGDNGPLMRQVSHLQVGKRARALGLSGRSAHEAWIRADVLLAGARLRLDAEQPRGAVLFSGTRASELNVVLRDSVNRVVKVASSRLLIDEAIQVRRPGTWLDLGAAELQGVLSGPRFQLRIVGAHGATVSGGAFADGRWAVLVHGARDVTLRDGRFRAFAEGGVAFADAPGALLGRASLTRIGGAPVLVHGASERATLIDNDIIGNTGSSNWHAGIVITDRNEGVADDPGSLLGPDGYGVREQRIDSRLRGPRAVVVAFNRIAGNGSSGIYSDGAIGAVMVGNVIEGNAKEGICLDNGSTANVVTRNLVRLNGKRWGKTDAQLQLDFVLRNGRLADGSAAAKTPGISLDNALYNIVYANHVDRTSAAA